MRFETILIAFFLCLNLAHGQQVFKVGDIVKMECMNESGDWVPGPVCAETGEPMPIEYGIDTLVFCGVSVPDDDAFKKISRILEQKDNWNCRIPVAPESEMHIPIVIPLWGIAEPSHYHAGNHNNFVIHVDRGRVIGAGIYPVRDRFQSGRAGSLLHLHTPIRWFNAHSYVPLSRYTIDGGYSGPLADTSGNLLVALGVGVGFCLALVVGFFIYKYVLRPRLLKKLIAGKQD